MKANISIKRERKKNFQIDSARHKGCSCLFCDRNNQPRQAKKSFKKTKTEDKPFRPNFLRCQLRACWLPHRRHNSLTSERENEFPVNELLLFNHVLIDFQTYSLSLEGWEIKVVRLKESEQIISTNYIFLFSDAAFLARLLCIFTKTETLFSATQHIRWTL